MVTNSMTTVAVHIDATSVVTTPIAVGSAPALAAHPRATELIVAAAGPAAERVPLLRVHRHKAAVAHDELVGCETEAGLAAEVDGVAAVLAAAVEVFGFGAHAC